MKKLISLIALISIVLMSSIVSAAEISVLRNVNVTNKNGTISTNDRLLVSQSGLSGDRDWAGVYPAGSDNSWSNVIAWNWVDEDLVSLDKIKKEMPEGKYELRLFFHNSFTMEAKQVFYVGKASLPISTVKENYDLQEQVTVTVGGELSGDQDWAGIYPASSDNSWGNVIAWNWVTGSGEINLDEIKKEMPAGVYKARLFFHNSLESEAEYIFTVGMPITDISTVKDNYNSQELVSVDNMIGLSGDQDWAGIYPVGSDNSWSNVIAWNWVTEYDGEISLDRIRKEMPAGNYEVRLFFYNSFELEAKTAFSVGAVDYAAYGSYTPIREDISQRISIYKPKKDGAFKQHSPVVIVGTGGWGGTGKKQEKFINFIVSKGYFVIGVGTSSDRDAEFNRILGALNSQGNLVDKTKIGLMGSSTGGGTIFYNLKRLKDNGYATKSFVISLDGWFALGLTSAEVRNLHTTTLLLQFGGADGLRYDGTETVNLARGDNDHYQDPRILMGIYNMLSGNEKSLSYLNNNVHGYASGSMNDKEDMLNVVGAMLAYKFENGGQAAKNIALSNKYDEINAAKSNVGQYHYGCTENIANQYYDYCDVNNPQ